MSDIALFDNMPDEFKELLGQLEVDTNAAGRATTGGVNRLSIRGSVFRKVVNGQEVGELEERAIKAVIVKSAPISRMYYAGQYVAGQNNPPTCWSADTNTGKPSEDVDSGDIQSLSCFDCQKNIKGSGMGEGRACRFQQRVALLLANGEGKVVSKEIYQLSLPATSVFGDDKQKMGLQSYARFLNSQERPVPLASLLTEIRFDTDSSTPKLCFKPLRVLEQSEIGVAVEIQRDEKTAQLIKLSVKPKDDTSTRKLTSDKVDPPAAIFKKPEELKEEAKVEAKEEEPIEEPKVKATKKSKVENVPAGDVDLASLLDEYDD